MPKAACWCLLLLAWSFTALAQRATPAADYVHRWIHVVQGKRLALVVNQTSRVGNRHLVDTLLALGQSISRVFAPEHGFRGEADAGAHIASGKDSATGLPIVSLYGKRKKPLPDDLADVDLIVFDIQDVGARFYTYISTLHYVLEAAAEQGKPVLVLDRPNPNGMFVDGPVLEPAYKSFVGIWPLPILHGCTVGELARMATGERWIGHADSLTLMVIPAWHYTHDSSYTLPVRPSPNLPNTQAIELYASLCLFEGTTLSVGRGTDFPFQVVGGRDKAYGRFQFTPKLKPGAAATVLAGQTCYGLDLQDTTLGYGFDLGPLMTLYARCQDKEHFFIPFFSKLAGTAELERQIKAGASQDEIRAGWEPALRAYRRMRSKYVLYP